MVWSVPFQASVSSLLGGFRKVMVLGVRRHWAVNGAEEETLNAFCKGYS